MRMSAFTKKELKKWHEKYIIQRDFKGGDLVLLFNSRLKLFPGKLRSRLFGPFQVLKVYLFGTIEIFSEKTRPFKVNGQRLKVYKVREDIEMGAALALVDPT